ncbi:MAG: hypothetical protein AAFQ66_21290 [Pseudomonadota bacterium]
MKIDFANNVAAVEITDNTTNPTIKIVLIAEICCASGFDERDISALCGLQAGRQIFGTTEQVSPA